MTVFTTARYCIVLQTNLIQFTHSHSTSIQCVPVSIFHLFLDLINISFPCHFLTKDVCVCVCVCVCTSLLQTQAISHIIKKFYTLILPQY